eukprot:GCRY01002363.1.p1 GENE.GCRY01002363.1~~GCRY01002363.1.p1  ORF type:complete len:437 (+),score=137.97 GCRY01002363.1:188-1498(+)
MADEENYVPSVGVDEGKKRGKAPVEADSFSFILAEDISDKLRLLNYEVLFCDIFSFKRLEPYYFAMAAKDATEQFYYFTSLTSWLMSIKGNHFTPPQQFDDPNATATTIMVELKKMGLQIDFPASKIKQGYGEAVCEILNQLCDLALKQRGFAFQRPVFKEEGNGEGVEEVAGVEEAIEEETGYASAEDSDDDDLAKFAAPSARDRPPSGRQAKDLRDLHGTPTSPAVGHVDPAKWKLEVERVTPLLRVKVAGDIKDWRAHTSQLHTLLEKLDEMVGPVQRQLKAATATLQQHLEKIATREKHINQQFETLLADVKKGQDGLTEATEHYTSRSGGVTRLTAELAEISDELARIKDVMDEESNKITDASPLQSIKQALAKMKMEIKQMDLRAGVLQHSLQVAKTRERKAQREGKPTLAESTTLAEADDSDENSEGSV